MYDRLSDEEKKLFVQMTMQDKSSEEILSALQKQSAQLSNIQRDQQTFTEDFLSNLSANAVWSGLTWIGGKLLRNIRF